MNARDYAKNSCLQRQCTNLLKEKVDEEIVEKFDVKSLSSASGTICVADLGCAAGPNTFIAMNNVIKAMEQKYQIQCPDSQMPRFQVFFNDLASNDFNTRFNSLPQDRQYFVAAVLGSFYRQLFPDSSIHFVYTSYAMHWLSKLPKELQAWNKGRIHEVVNAYSIQFTMDMENFLNARAKELVAGGMMIIIMPACQNGMPYSSLPAGVMFDVMASSLMEMVEEGLISETQVDSLNYPLYAASSEEMVELIEGNGSFSIERMELTVASTIVRGRINIQEWTTHSKIAMEGHLLEHFETEVIDEMFNRVIIKLSECYDHLESTLKNALQLFVVLKRKYCDLKSNLDF